MYLGLKALVRIVIMIIIIIIKISIICPRPHRLRIVLNKIQRKLKIVVRLIHLFF